MPQHYTFHLLAQGRRWGVVHLQTHAVIPPATATWLRAAVAATYVTLPAFKAAPWSVAFNLTQAAAARAANQQFRGKDYTPDVLSFPLWEAGHAGDVLLCWPALKAAALQQGKPLKAHFQHLVVHAMLHLAGHDHTTQKQAGIMEAKEVAVLSTLGWPNPYLPD